MLSLTNVLNEVWDKNKFFAQKAIQKKINTLPPTLPTQTDKKEVANIDYYQQVLNQSRLEPQNRRYFQSVINSIKKQNNLASPKQLVILKKILG
jgi:predicted KAP-like P-loop ATPase